MFQLRATRVTLTRSWQATCHPSQDLHRAYSLLRRQSDLMPRTISSSSESTDTTATPSAEGTASKPVLLISRLSQRNAAPQTTHRSPTAHRGNFKAELEDDRGPDSLRAKQNPLARRRSLNAESDADPHGPATEAPRGNQSLIARRSTLGAELDVGPDGREKNGRRGANRDTYARRRTTERDGRGTESLGATSFLSTQSAKSRDNAAAKWLKGGGKDLEGFANGDQGEYYEEENGVQEEEDEEFMNESPYDVIREMDAMSEEQVAEWERVTWPKTIQKLRDQNAAEREAVAAATYTDLKELFGPVSAPLDSPRLQALKELGGDYASYIPPGYAPARKYSMAYTRLALGRNNQIPLKAQTEALRVIEASIVGRVTRTG